MHTLTLCVVDRFQTEVDSAQTAVNNAQTAVDTATQAQAAATGSSAPITVTVSFTTTPSLNDFIVDSLAACWQPGGAGNGQKEMGKEGQTD